MKDVLLAPAPQSDRDGTAVTNNDVNHSIVNSVTNDEDDWVDSRKNSVNSIVNSVTNDEDDWNESRNNSGGTAVTIQHRPCNYRSAFSTSSMGMNNHQKHDVTMNEFNHNKSREQTTSALPPLPMFEPTPSSSKFFDQESYLIRYEHMMEEQEMEQISTLSHVQYLLELSEDLLLDGKDEAYRNHTSRSENNNLLKEFTFVDLKRVQEKIEHSNEFDIIKTDKQFLMVLEILCEEKDNSTAVVNSEEKQDKISWAEIIQCYRTCVVGMQTLEIIGSHGTIRKRAKERTLAVLSLYRKSSSANSSHSLTVSPNTCGALSSKMRNGDNVIQSSGCEQGSQQDSRPRRLLGHPFVSVFTGAMIAAIWFSKHHHPAELMTQSRDIPSANPTQSLHCPIVVNESFSSTGREFEVLENTIDIPSPEKSVSLTMNVTQDQLVNEASTFKKKTISTTTTRVVSPIARARTANSIALLPSDLSQKVEAFDQKINNNFAKEVNYNNMAKKLTSSDLKVANVIWGTAIAISFLSLSSRAITAVLSWAPMGLIVMIATLAAHSVRDVISGIWRKLRRNDKKRNTVSIKYNEARRT